MALTKISGSILKDPLNLGEVSIGGTLTYQDVTNVDSVGIITARSNIDCNGDLDVDGHTDLDNVSIAGVTTFSSNINVTGSGSFTKTSNNYILVGSSNAGGASLVLDGDSNGDGSGTDYAYIEHDSSGNLNIVGDNPANASNIIFKTNSSTERLRIDSGGRLYTGGSTQTLDSTAGALHLHGGTAGGRLAFRGTTTSASTGIAEVFAFWDTNKVAGMIAKSGTDTTNKDDGSLHFYTNTGSGISERHRIASDGSSYRGGTPLTESDLNWNHDTYQRPHIFSGITGGSPADGAIVSASVAENPSNTRIGAFIFGCKTSSSSGVSNSGLKAYIEVYTNTNVSDAWKTGGYMKFSTRPDNGNPTERLRIDSSGNVIIGHSAANAKLHIASGTSSAVGDATNPALQIGSTANYRFAIHTTNEQAIIANKNGDDGIAFHTKTASGGSFGEALRITSGGHVLPAANNAYDLGSTAKGWRNVYMNDLNLSNMKGNTNDVDGTQGSWTIQEGKDDLYIINRLNGKKFKIKMEEIS